MRPTPLCTEHQWSSGRIHRCHRCDLGQFPAGAFCLKFMAKNHSVLATFLSMPAKFKVCQGPILPGSTLARCQACQVLSLPGSKNIRLNWSWDPYINIPHSRWEFCIAKPGFDPGTFGLWAQHGNHCAISLVGIHALPNRGLERSSSKRSMQRTKGLSL